MQVRMQVRIGRMRRNTTSGHGGKGEENTETLRLSSDDRREFNFERSIPMKNGLRESIRIQNNAAKRRYA